MAAASAASVTVTLLPSPPPRVEQRRPVDIEELLRWTYRQQKAHLIEGRPLPELAALAGGSGSSAATVERILRLGCIVDQSGPERGAIHPDAATVHAVVERLDAKRRGLPLSQLLIGHARSGERPDWMPGAVPLPQPVLTLRGRIHVEWTDAGRRSGFCPLVYDPSPARIAEARMEYAMWHRGLRLLALELQRQVRAGERGALVRWYPLAPEAPEAPWETATAK